METLPPEVLEMIIQDLTPKDLARCSAVSRKWRDIFNQDWLWEAHCDHELEEPLRTIPSVAMPAFVIPQDSTLTPLCRWRKSFMREKRLWRNWEYKKMKEVKKGNIIIEYNDVEFKWLFHEKCRIDFLTDTLIVVWCSNQIKIFDVSVMPGALTSEISTSIQESDVCVVTESYKLLVQNHFSLKVFSVEIISKSIRLQHTIAFGCFISRSTAVGNAYLCIKHDPSELLIFDLEIGNKIKEETCPMKSQCDRASFFQLTSSPTSDYVAVEIIVSFQDNQMYTYYIYNLKQLIFLPGPVAKTSEYCKISFHEPYLALNGSELTIYNFQTREVVLRRRKTDWKAISALKFSEFTDDCFIFIDNADGQTSIYMYTLSDGSLTKSNCKIEAINRIQIINNKFLAIFDVNSDVPQSVWEVSGRSVKKSDICILSGTKSNRSFTKVTNKAYKVQSNRKVKATWYVSHLW